MDSISTEWAANHDGKFKARCYSTEKESYSFWVIVYDRSDLGFKLPYILDKYYKQEYSQNTCRPTFSIFKRKTTTQWLSNKKK